MINIQQTPEEYYSNEDNHGKYQYISLSEIINEIVLESKEDDHYLKNTKRTTILLHAKQGIRELNRSVANDILAFEITVPDNLYFPLPQDYVNWVRISVVVNENSGFYLRPLNINYKIHTAIGYLQDNKAEILFDHNGQILMADSLNSIAQPYKKYSFNSCPNKPYLDTSKLSKNGEFAIDNRRGFISFSSDLADKEVVIEYVSDGLQSELYEEDITIHKYLKQPLKDYIYYHCIAYKMNVPYNEKQRALNKYKSSRHQSAIAMSDLDIKRISRAIKSKTIF